MMSSALKVIGCLFAVCLTVDAQTPAQKTNTSTISGKVTYKGNGLPGIAVGARLTQSGNPRNALVVTTDQLGNYRITSVAPGQYEVLPAAPQFLLGNQAPSRTLIVAEGENLENVDFALIRGGVITGRVTDADGRPMIEEQVELFSMGGSDAKPLILMNLYAGATDDRGVYRIFGLRPGKYRIAAGTSEDRLPYGRGRAVYGQTFHPSTTEESEAKLIEVTEGSEATNVDITLRRTLNLFTIHARVVDGETGKPVPNAMYGLQRTRENGSWSTSGFAANHLGEIRIDSMTPGKYAIFLEPSPVSDVYSDPVQFEVVDQDIKDLVIKTWSGSSVSGVVVLDGFDPKLAASRNELVIFARTESKTQMHGSSPTGIINSDGSFKVGGLRPGPVQFGIWGRRMGPMVAFEIIQIERDGVVVQPNTIEIKAGEQIKGLRLITKARTGHIRGVVKLENGQLPFSQIYVTVKKIGDMGGPSVRTDERGRFMSEPMAAGVYELIVHAYPSHGGRSASTKQQVVVADNQVTDVTLTLDLKNNSAQGRP